MMAAEEDGTTWDAYSDYKDVSNRLTKSIDSAIEAFSLLDQAKQTGYKVPAKVMMQERAEIVAAAMRLRVELEAEAERDEEYATDILEKWTGVGDEPGYLTQFRTAPPGGTAELEFLEEFATDIRRAGWHLGYLQAGREQEKENQGESGDSEVYQMIEEMTV